MLPFFRRFELLIVNRRTDGKTYIILQSPTTTNNDASVKIKVEHDNHNFNAATFPNAKQNCSFLESTIKVGGLWNDEILNTVQGAKCDEPLKLIKRFASLNYAQDFKNNEVLKDEAYLEHAHSQDDHEEVMVNDPLWKAKD